MVVAADGMALEHLSDTALRCSGKLPFLAIKTSKTMTVHLVAGLPDCLIVQCHLSSMRVFWVWHEGINGTARTALEMCEQGIYPYIHGS